MTSLHTLNKNISISLLGAMVSTKIQWGLWVCCNVLPDREAGDGPSLSKCHCDVKVAARLFLESLITEAGRRAWKCKTLSLCKKASGTLQMCMPVLLVSSVAERQPGSQRGSFKGCLSIQTSMALAKKGETGGRAKWSLMPPWTQVYCAETILVVMLISQDCISLFKIFQHKWGSGVRLLHHAAFWEGWWLLSIYTSSSHTWPPFLVRRRFCFLHSGPICLVNIMRLN